MGKSRGFRLRQLCCQLGLLAYGVVLAQRLPLSPGRWEDHG